MSKLNLHVHSHASAMAFLEQRDEPWPVICITNSGQLIPKIIQKYAEGGPLHLIFDDIDCPLGQYMMPALIDVKASLLFAENKTRLLITCPTGLTRSPALAYAIRCTYQTPQEAVRNLVNTYHHPNRLIIKHAASILNNDEIYRAYLEWMPKAVFRTNTEYSLR